MWCDLDARRVFVATGGEPFDPARPVVLLVHGAGADHSVWALQSRGLARRGFAVLACDLPGHGRSGGAAPVSIAAIADGLADLLAAVGGARATVVGHSMGALAALDLAARHPERVGALVLLGAAARMPVHPDLLAAARDDLPRAAAMIAGWGHGGAPGGVPGLHPPALTRRLVEASPPGVLAAGLAACAAYDGTEAAARVRAPTLLLVGGADRMSPAKAGQALAGLIPGARITRLEGAGHMLMADRPEAVLDALLTL
ncbi:MAG: hypothetical protein RLZZ501_2085 [Pseudomonadota bacterium]|jgi:pimeloyl-ACP methyl ester carboxylesterase